MSHKIFCLSNNNGKILTTDVICKASICYILKHKNLFSWKRYPCHRPTKDDCLLLCIVEWQNCTLETMVYKHETTNHNWVFCNFSCRCCYTNDWNSKWNNIDLMGKRRLRCEGTAKITAQEMAVIGTVSDSLTSNTMLMAPTVKSKYSGSVTSLLFQSGYWEKFLGWCSCSSIQVLEPVWFTSVCTLVLSWTLTS
jgi:hypothetical protein